MTFPSFYDPERVGTLFQPDLLRIQREAEAAAIPPASGDRRRTALVLIDFQVDFCHPTGSLVVPGAIGDLRRAIEFICRNAAAISEIHASLDSHVVFQIFHPAWWAGPDGKHPAPFTPIPPEEVRSGRWRPLFDPEWSRKYVEALAAGGRQMLIIWPYHTMVGAVGQALDPALHEALLFHSMARREQVRWLIKGTIPKTEYYSILEPEVKIETEPRGTLNTAFLESVARNDAVYLAGEAKSHCVLATIRSIMEYFKERPESIRKFRLLEDCTSSVKHPTIDFEGTANAELARYEKLGFGRVRSTDPLATS
ncbi:MAG: cysteine hydrolase family protein [Planctomycetes bacterium]|nr:cysteine hydrolase family protein [Planctomycetota bacterium]